MNTYYETTLGVWIHAESYDEAGTLAYLIHGIKHPRLRKH